MRKKEYSEIAGEIAGISPYIRFVAVVGGRGDLLYHHRRRGLRPMLDSKDTHYQFSHIAIKTGLEAAFDRALGPLEFVWEERKKVQILSFAIKKTRVWVSVDKKVVRSEMLRIIDSCLPVVRRYS